MFTGILPSLRFRYKILVTYLVLSVVPLGLLGLFSATNSMRTMRNETDRYIQHILHQSIASIEYKLDEVVSTAEYVVTNEEMQNILRRSHGEYQDIGAELDDFAVLRSNLLAIESNKLIESARIYFASQTLYSSTRASTYPIADFPRPELLESPYVRYHWYTTTVRKMSYSPQAAIAVAAPIVDLQDVRDRLAVIEIVCKMRLLSTAFEGGILVDDAFAVVTEGSRVILTSPADRNLGDLNIEQCVAPYNRPQSDVGGEPYRVAQLEIPNTPWRAFMFLPLRQITVGTRQIALFTVGMTVLIVLADVLAAVFFSNLLSRRLQALVESMKRTGAGHRRIPVPVTGSDEISVLEREYNTMISALDALFERVKDAADRRRVAEYKALEAQINPHFLYNMLEGIKWLGLRGRKREMVDVIETMSDLFRYNLNRGSEVVTLDDELDSIRKYVRLQNLRYSDTITLEVSVSDGLLAQPMIKLILQPIVENAIVHGIQKTLRRRGTVRIDITDDERSNFIAVRDDGVGVDGETAESILSADSTGYGLRNVAQRLHFYYGESSSIRVDSSPGAGTTVTLVIPKSSIGHETPSDSCRDAS